MNAAIQQKLESIRDLPTLPAVIGKLNKAVADPNMDAGRIALLLRDDPAISARILRVANSARYAGSEPFTSVQAAVARMGMAGVRNVATSAAVFSTLSGGPHNLFDRQEFWRHCILCGVAATVLFRTTRARLTRRHTDDVLHLAGLVHDMGRIVLDQYFHAEFAAGIALGARALLPLIEAEQRTTGTDHAEVGAWLAKRWNVGEEIQQAIRWHHDPPSADAAYQELASLCNAGNYICNYQQLGWSGDSAPAYLPFVWNSLGLSPNDAQAIGDQIKAEGAGSELLTAFG